MHICKANAGLAALFSAFIMWPASGLSLTLQEAVLAASLYDSEISAARNAQRADSQKRLQGFAGLLPVVSLNGSYIKQDQPRATYAAGVTRHNYSLNLTQPLFDIAKYAAWKRGDAIANYADVTLMQAEQTLIASVAEAWFHVIYQRDVLASAIKAKSAFDKQLKQTQLALKVGEGTRLDRDEAQANYDRAAADVIAAENDLQEAGIVFSRLTGLNPDSIQPIALSCVMRIPLSDNHNALQQRASMHNLKVRAALFRLEQTQADVIAAHGAHLPVVTLQAGYGTNWSKAEDSNLLDLVFGTTSKTRSSSIGINVSVPLFAGGSQISQSVEAIRRREQGKDLLEDARRKARQETQAAWLKLKNGHGQYLAEKKALASAKNKVNSTAYGRKVGLRTIIDELNAEQDYYKSLQALAKIKYEYLNARIKLSMALGELDYSSLEQYRCANNKIQPLTQQDVN